MPTDSQTLKTYIYTRFHRNYEKKIKSKKTKLSPGGGHFDYRWKAENLIRWSLYSWVPLRKKLVRSDDYFSSYRVNKNFFKSLTLTFDLWPWPWVKKCQEGLNVCINYEPNLLHHVGVLAKRVCASAAAAHEGDDNTHSGPTGRGVKITPSDITASTRRWPNVVLMLACRLRRRPYIETTLGQRLMFADKNIICFPYYQSVRNLGFMLSFSIMTSKCGCHIQSCKSIIHTSHGDTTVKGRDVSHIMSSVLLQFGPQEYQYNKI